MNETQKRMLKADRHFWIMVLILIIAGIIVFSFVCLTIEETAEVLLEKYYEKE
jgi:hypothetical protein